MIDKIERHNNKQKEILEQLDKVEQPYRSILEKVYILGKSLSEVSVDLSLEYKYVCKKHGIALNIFDNLE